MRFHKFFNLITILEIFIYNLYLIKNSILNFSQYEIFE